MTPAGTPSSAAPGALALRLLGKWTSLLQGHAPLAMSCSCGSALPAVSVSDFEQMIVEHALDKYRGRIDAEPALARAIGEAAQEGELASLLKLLARQREPAALVGDLLKELAGSIDSLDELHAGG